MLNVKAVESRSLTVIPVMTSTSAVVITEPMDSSTPPSYNGRSNVGGSSSTLVMVTVPVAVAYKKRGASQWSDNEESHAYRIWGLTEFGLAPRSRAIISIE